MPSMMPEPVRRSWLSVVRDVAAIVLIVSAVVGLGLCLWSVTPVAGVLYGFVVLGVAGFVLASEWGR